MEELSRSIWIVEDGMILDHDTTRSSGVNSQISVKRLSSHRVLILDLMIHIEMERLILVAYI